MTDTTQSQSVDISKTPSTTEKPDLEKIEKDGKEAKEKEDIQTTEEETEETAKSKTSEEDADVTENSDQEQGEDKPDADGMYTHPDTKTKVAAADMVSYYKGKFGMSTAGAQQLLTEKNTLTGTIAEKERQLSERATEIENLRKIAEGENPEGLKLLDLQTSAKKNAEELALLKEDKQLDDFIKGVPLAENKKDALRSLARAMPTKSLTDIWNESFKAGAEAEAKVVTDKKITQKKTAGDKGKGTSTRDPAAHTIGGYTPAEFNKLSVEKRKQVMIKEGLV